jgi:hypothetical protein
MSLDPHPSNAPGPFYVVREGCMACTAPEYEAPDLMAHVTEPYYHCYFKKQPSTAEEVERAIWASCCGAVRYASAEPDVIARLSQLESASSCDQLTGESDRSSGSGIR